MKKSKLLWTLALVLLVLTLFCGCGNEDPGQVTVTLPGNPTTGYSWTYTMTGDGALREVESGYCYKTETPGKKTVGQGGTFTFTFEGEREGDVTLDFVYAQPWEGGNKGEEQTFTYHVDKDLRIKEVK